MAGLQAPEAYRQLGQSIQRVSEGVHHVFRQGPSALGAQLQRSNAL